MILVTSISKTLLARSLKLAGWPVLGRLLVVLNVYHLWMMEANVLSGTFSAAGKFSAPFPRSVPRYNLVGCLQTIPWTSWLGLCFCVYLFKSHPQADSQSSCRNICQIISGNRMYQSSILSATSNALNTYVHVIFLYLFLINLQEFQANIFTFS